MMYRVTDVARGWELFGLADWHGARVVLVDGRARRRDRVPPRGIRGLPARGGNPHGRWPAVDRTVPAEAAIVVVGVLGLDYPADEAVAPEC